MAQTEEQMMEDIRESCFAMTLRQATDRNICIACKRSIVLCLSEEKQTEWNHYEETGFCPSCFDTSNSPSTEYREHKRNYYAK
jgi:hypothetical protein